MAQEFGIGYFHEGETQVPTFVLKQGDEDGDPVPLADISSATLTLTDQAGTVINSRSGQDVLNANDVTIDDTSGLVAWTMQAADTTMASSSDATAKHDARFVFTLTDGQVRHVHLRFTVGQGPT
jgi:uncharacterized protein YndB with AHSA1/START domain